MNPDNKFIVDTNTLISAFLVINSLPYAALAKAQTTGILLFSEETFLEFELVLLRNKFDRYFSKEERLQIIERLYLESVFIPITSDLKICRDVKDDKFLNLAVDSIASCIITGDRDLLVLHPFGNVPILTPTDFVVAF